jgi:hypothetical protein
MGSQPHACVASIRVNAPVARAASTTPSRSATRPSADWTALTATSPTSSDTDETSRSSGTRSTETPRGSWASSGNRSDVKSSSAHTTRVPGASDSATSPTNADTCVPTATSPGPTPTSDANSSRPRSIDSTHPYQLVRPCRHSSSTASCASHAGRGGRP